MPGGDDDEELVVALAFGASAHRHAPLASELHGVADDVGKELAHLLVVGHEKRQVFGYLEAEIEPLAHVEALEQDHQLAAEDVGDVTEEGFDAALKEAKKWHEEVKPLLEDIEEFGEDMAKTLTKMANWMDRLVGGFVGDFFAEFCDILYKVLSAPDRLMDYVVDKSVEAAISLVK